MFAFVCLVLCLCATAAVVLLGLTIWSVVLHVLRAEARSREMVMAMAEEWREYRRDEHAAERPEPEPVDKEPDNGFPDDLLPQVHVS